METGHLSAVDLFMQAGPVVKGVFVLLILSSIWCWAIILRSYLGLLSVRNTAYRLSNGKQGKLVAPLIAAGREEANLQYEGELIPDHQARVAAAMRRKVAELVERQQSGVQNLAVISSVAPFIGLFGTVWGIMTSFIGIAAAKDTSLAVVAPGIAEALGATAVGLAAAIPAAFAYNCFATAFSSASRRLVRVAEDVARDIARAPNQ